MSPMSIHARMRMTPHTAKVLTEDEAQIASNIAKLPTLLTKT